MPAEALPYEQPEPLTGLVHHERAYRDVLGRPMSGTVTLTGTRRRDADGLTVLPAPVTVKLVGGVLAVDLPPDTYTYAAVLRTVDGERVEDRGEFTLT